MKFRRLAIQNYRSIRKADFNLGQITVIIGPSDSGKSNVIRALRDWCYNAVGTGMITKGKSVCRVALAIDETHKVVFEKSLRDTKRGRARYVMKEGETNETLSFEKIGRTVPEEIQRVTGIRLVTVDDVSIRVNLAEQSEPWFLLSNPPWNVGRVSRVVGKISGVDALILANKDLSHKRGVIKRERGYAEKRIEERQAEIEKRSWVVEADELVSEAEEKFNSLEKEKAKLKKSLLLLRSIREAKEKLKQKQRHMKKVAYILERIDSFDFDISDKLDRAVILTSSITAKKNKKRKIESAREKSIENLEVWKGHLKKIISDHSLVCPLCGESAHEECISNLESQAK